ncbi:hypothetical protein Q1695_008468 [Nippostrongylus brasiliensis]|nr:hypothetical protein Q1695_008468 [Nippostrongylus brasiliensis]
MYKNLVSAIQFHFIFATYCGCTLMLFVAYRTIYDLFDELAEFRECINNDLITFTKYAIEAHRTMILRPKMTERAVFDALIRLQRNVQRSDFDICLYDTEFKEFHAEQQNPVAVSIENNANASLLSICQFG